MEIPGQYKVTMYNDDVHDFPYIMACLIRFCNYDPIQAEQSALIAHTNGQCNIKSGNWDDMFELTQVLISLEIKAMIESYEGSVY
jgi:ATP-dependent Clp protease adaptor protein ClpS